MEQHESAADAASTQLKTRTVRFDVTMELELPVDVLFDRGDLIEIEGEELEVKDVIRGGAWTSNPWHDLVVVLKRPRPAGGRFDALRAHVTRTEGNDGPTDTTDLP